MKEFHDDTSERMIWWSTTNSLRVFMLLISFSRSLGLWSCLFSRSIQQQHLFHSNQQFTSVLQSDIHTTILTFTDQLCSLARYLMSFRRLWGNHHRVGAVGATRVVTTVICWGLLSFIIGDSVDGSVGGVTADSLQLSLSSNMSTTMLVYHANRSASSLPTDADASPFPPTHLSIYIFII